VNSPSRRKIARPGAFLHRSLLVGPRLFPAFVFRSLAIRRGRFSYFRHQKSVAEFSSVSVSLAEIAIAVCEPLGPRLFLDLAGGITGFLDRPLSYRPVLGPPSISFPLIMMAIDDSVIWPVWGDESREILNNTLRGVVYVGNPPAAVVQAACRNCRLVRAFLPLDVLGFMIHFSFPTLRIFHARCTRKHCRCIAASSSLSIASCRLWLFNPPRSKPKSYA
jgi:hypothetical protein